MKNTTTAPKTNSDGIGYRLVRVGSVIRVIQVYVSPRTGNRTETVIDSSHTDARAARRCAVRDQGQFEVITGLAQNSVCIDETALGAHVAEVL